MDVKLENCNLLSRGVLRCSCYVGVSGLPPEYSVLHWSGITLRVSFLEQNLFFEFNFPQDKS